MLYSYAVQAEDRGEIMCVQLFLYVHEAAQHERPRKMLGDSQQDLLMKMSADCAVLLESEWGVLMLSMKKVTSGQVEYVYSKVWE